MTPRVYIEAHILQTVPPANLNRDDQGNPKEALYGGARRSRVSSQAWKRATRKHFAGSVPQQDLGTRTLMLGKALTTRLNTAPGVDPAAAARLAAAAVNSLGVKKKDVKEGKIEKTSYLLFVGHRQLDEIADLAASLAPELPMLSDKELTEKLADPVKTILTQGHSLDVALFGRMVADIPALNVDAAVQVAHAISTHAADLEFDYYTAVDDENERGETGAGMIGSIGFNSATLYRYAAIGLEQLTMNLAEPQAAIDAVDLFVDSFTKSMPTGYANSFAHRTLPSFVAVTVREDQPVNLVSAFEKPVMPRDYGIAEASALRLTQEYERSVSQWGDKPAYTAYSHRHDGKTHTELAAVLGNSVSFPELRDGLRTHLEGYLGR